LAAASFGLCAAWCIPIVARFSLAPGFSRVEGGRQNKNRFNGFSQTATEPKKKAVKTARLT
jgi:DsbC/DsbD-like thiol-disulfide interchange protein